MFLTKLRRYDIPSSTLTMLGMARWNLVTKEKVKKAAEGKLKNEGYWKDCEGSINDDLESYLINLQNQKDVTGEFVYSFFTPKLTDDELKLVQEGNEEHLKSYLDYFYGKNPDVDDKEMKDSDFKSKYVHGECLRMTIPLRLETNENAPNGVSDQKHRYNIPNPIPQVGPSNLPGGPGWRFEVYNDAVREHIGRFSYFRSDLWHSRL